MTSVEIESLEMRIAESGDRVEEAQLLEQLARAVLWSEPVRALKAMRRALKIARSSGDRRFLADKLTKLADCHRNIGENDRALECLNEALELVDALPETHVGFLYGSLGRVHQALGNYPQAHSWLQAAIDLAERIGNYEQQSTASLSLAELYRIAGDVRKTLELHARGLELAERIDDIALIALITSSLGIVYASINEYEAARRAFERGVAMNRKGGYRSGEAAALMNLGELCATMGELDIALGYDRDALVIFRQISGRIGEAACLENIGWIYARRGYHHTALEYYEQALSISDLSPLDPVKRGMVLARMGESLAMLEEYERAGRCGDEVLGIALNQDHRPLECQAYEMLAKLHELQGEPAVALDFQKRFVALKLEIAGEDAKKAVVAMQARLDIERAEKEREIYRLKSERLEMELAHKNRELASVALDLAQKSEIVRRLEKAMNPFLSAGDTDAATLMRELMPQVRELVAGGAQWGIFEQQFREAHPEFVKALLGRCPALTPTEIRLCTLMRIEMSNKDLADILRSSIRTVENHRRHIRQKLGLGREANLTTFLAALG